MITIESMVTWLTPLTVAPYDVAVLSSLVVGIAVMASVFTSLLSNSWLGIAPSRTAHRDRPISTEPVIVVLTAPAVSVERSFIRRRAMLRIECQGIGWERPVTSHVSLRLFLKGVQQTHSLHKVAASAVNKDLIGYGHWELALAPLESQTDMIVILDGTAEDSGGHSLRFRQVSRYDRRLDQFIPIEIESK